MTLIRHSPFNVDKIKEYYSAVLLNKKIIPKIEPAQSSACRDM
jgi:hypothetical protein